MSRAPDDDARAPDAGAYANYAEWKHWDGAFTTTPKLARYLAAEFRGIALAGKRVLEIGFGNGGFLAWARAEGAEVSGLELNDAMREAARRHGYPAHEGSLADLAAGAARYDLIVAFDVIEHWDTDELVANFAHIRTLLVPGGCFIARFPNGHSPFGRIFQHGDFTHKSTLSAYKIEYLALTTGFAIVRIDDERRVSSKPGPLRALRQHWLALRRRWIERSISRIYGIRRLPLAPNLVAVLQRPATENEAQESTNP